jgi:uncharacterized membrane protein required for colicin V production
MKVGIIIDLIIVVLFILSVWEGYKKGLTKSLLKIFTFILAIIISFILFKPISSFIINQTQIDDNIQETIIKTFEEEDVKENKQEIKEKKEAKETPNIFYNYIEDKIMQVGDEAKEYVIETASREITDAIIDIIVFIVVFIISRIILIFIKAIADLITKIPVIKQFDELGGGIYGLLRAIVIIMILFTILAIVLPFMQNANSLTIIDESILSKFIYENNMIIRIIL